VSNIIIDVKNHNTLKVSRITIFYS